MRRFLLLIILLSFTALPAKAEITKHAFILSNSDYVEVADLQTPQTETDEYADFLAGHDYKITRVRNETQENILEAFETFVEGLLPGDEVVLVYSGHGWSDGSTNFLVPTDAPAQATDKFLKTRTIPLMNGEDGLLDELRAAEVRIVAIIDACRTNPFKPPKGRRSQAMARGMTQMVANDGMFVVFSAGVQQEALDRLTGDPEGQRLSVFARSFLPLLRDGLYLEDAINEAQIKTSELARLEGGHVQQPAYYDQVLGSTCLGKYCVPRGIEASLQLNEALSLRGEERRAAVAAIIVKHPGTEAARTAEKLLQDLIAAVPPELRNETIGPLEQDSSQISDELAEDLEHFATGGTEIDLPDGVSIDLSAGPSSLAVGGFHVFSKDGSRLVITNPHGYQKKMLVVYDTEAMSVLSQKVISGDPGSLSFSENSEFLAVGISELTNDELPWVSRIELLRSDDLSLVRELSNVDDLLGRVASVTFSPDGKKIAAAASYTSADYGVWRVSDGKRIFTGKTGGKRTDIVKFSPDGTRLMAIGTEPNAWSVVDASNGRAVSEIDVTEVGTQHLITPHFSGDGKTIFAQTEFSTWAEPDSLVGEWNVSDGRLLRRFGNLKDGEDRVLGISQDDKQVAVLSGDRNIRFLRIEDGSVSDTLLLEGAETGNPGISGDLGKVALSYPYGLKLLELPSGRVIADIPSLASNVSTVAFSPDGRRLAMGLNSAYQKRVPAPAEGEDESQLQAYRAFGVWNWASGEPAFVDNGEQNTFASAGAMDWHPTKPWLAVAGKGDNIAIFETAGFAIDKRLAPLPDNDGSQLYGADGLEFITGSNLVLSGYGRNALKLWDGDTGEFVRSLGADNFAVSKQGDKVAAVDLHFGSQKLDRADLLLFNPEDGARLWTQDQEDNIPTAIEFTNAGERIIGLLNAKNGEGQGRRTRLAIWRATDGRLLASFGDFEGYVTRFALSANDRTAAIAHESGQMIEIWDIEERRKIRTLRLPNAEVSSLDMSPDGRFLAVGARPAQTFVFQVETAKLIAQFAIYADGTASFVRNRLQLSDQDLIRRVHAYLGGNRYASIKDLSEGQLPPSGTAGRDISALSPEEAMTLLKSGDKDLRIAVVEERAQRFDDGFRKQVQRILADAGHYNGAIDGLFGPNTLRGLSNYLQGI